MTGEQIHILREDAELIREALEDFSPYRFSAELRERMDAAGLSSAALARRCRASHTAVDKWCQGTARPNSKERMKLLAMALEMDEGAVNRFLFRNGYPRLYIKNPLDCAAKMLLQHRGARADNVSLYEEILARLHLEGFGTSPAGGRGDSGAMSEEFHRAVAETEVSGWFEAHRGDFRADDRRLRMDQEMAQLLRLYLGDSSVHELVLTGSLSAALKGTVYEIYSGKAVLVRSLREKLMALGWQLSLTDEELDTLLSFARLRGVTEPVKRWEQVQLMALRLAHERWPGYELANLEALERRAGTLTDESLKGMVQERLSVRLTELRSLMDYYERRAGPEERCFERSYTAWSDHTAADYLRDLNDVLEEQGVVKRGELEPLLRYFGRTEETQP